MKKEVEAIIMEQLKKGYRPVYEGEEGFIAISMKAYLAAAEYAGAERSYFWYGDVYFEMVDLNNRADEIEAEDYDFMPRKVEFDESSDKEIESEDVDSMTAETELEDAYSMSCKFKVGDIIRPNPEADGQYLHTGSDMTEAEVIAIKSRDLVEIKVRGHISKKFIGESFYVDPAYFELAGGDKSNFRRYLP